MWLCHSCHPSELAGEAGPDAQLEAELDLEKLAARGGSAARQTGARGDLTQENTSKSACRCMLGNELPFPTAPPFLEPKPHPHAAERPVATWVPWSCSYCAGAAALNVQLLAPACQRWRSLALKALASESWTPAGCLSLQKSVHPCGVQLHRAELAAPIWHQLKTARKPTLPSCCGRLSDW